MRAFPIRQGDRLPSLSQTFVIDREQHYIPIEEFVVTDSLAPTPTPVDLSAFTELAFQMTHVDGTPQIVGPAIGDAFGGATYAWQPGDTLVPGLYRGVFRGTDAQGRTQTFPTRKELVIQVVAKI